MLLVGVCVILVFPIVEMQWEKMKPKMKSMYEADQKQKKKTRDKRDTDHDLALQ